MLSSHTLRLQLRPHRSSSCCTSTYFTTSLSSSELSESLRTLAMGRSRPVFRGKWGISGPQSNYAHPEVQDARNQRSMTRKRTKGSRIKGMGVFEGEGHSLGK